MAIGLMGGTFNPIHMGHLLIGEYIREEWKLSKVIYIPSGNPPHKTGGEVLEASHRVKLVQLAIENNSFFELSFIELNREGFSFTIDTIRQMHLEYPYEKLYFIIGTDTLFELETWKSFQKIANEIEFIMYGRGRHSKKDVEEKLQNLREKHGFRIHRSNGPEIEISSTNIRDRINKGLSVKYMIPDSLIEEIEKESLYKGE
ncbi:nicotinate-nucleotide adenylyltransferase [Gudongella sp. DL1XJH-153]|uniref:nicotinate-nucleotide adenylyltransferase n=1 Tax=Gudongella sp. DL1XJH-153 TaxID=3409804 RepID=UPI003BB7BF10